MVWVDVKDRLPDDMREVLGIDDCGCYWLCYFGVIHNAFVESTDYEVVENILFWMPLPEKPENLGVN